MHNREAQKVAPTVVTSISPFGRFRFVCPHAHLPARLMSGRDPHLVGFGKLNASNTYASNPAPLWRSHRSTMNQFLSVCISFRLDRIEFVNAIHLYERCAIALESLPMIAGFLASLRLSVFWRRRRDILNQNLEEVVRILEICLCTEEDLLVAEKCILQHTGCLVWIGNTNIVEAVYVILGILSVKGEPLCYLKNTSVDICYILLAGIIHTSEHSTWYAYLPSIC